MRNAALLSTFFHGIILAVLIFGLPWFVEPPTSTVMPVQVVTPEDLEKSKPEPKPLPKPETTAEKVAPKPPPPVEQAKVEPEPPKPELEPEPEVEPEPEPPAPEAKPEPEVAPEPELKVAVLKPPKPRKRPEIKKAPPKEKKPPPDQLASILRNVERLKQQPEPPQQEKPEAEKPGPVSREVSVFEQNDMVRAIQQQLFSCWRLDPGAVSAEDMVVEIRVALNPDGSLQRADVVDVARLARDGYFRSAAENARRAIYKCSPFVGLPPNKYQVWRELTLRFNPREMFGT